MTINNSYTVKSFASLMIGLTVSLTSCSDFLDQTNETALTQEQVVSDVEMVETSVKTIYSNWKENYRDENCWLTLIGTDEIQAGALNALREGTATSAAWDWNCGYLNAENEKVKSLWENRMRVIAETSKFIKPLMEEDAQPGSIKEQLLAELSFIRGILNYQCTMFWGRIPVLDGNEDYSRKSEKEVWQFILDDFTRATKAPETNDVGRANKWAGYAMLGKAYMSAPESTGLRNFQKAAEAYKQVIDGGHYRLMDNFADLYDYTKSAADEVIFAHTFSPARGYANQVQFQIGSRAAQNWFSDACSFAGYDKAVPTQYAYSAKSEGGLWEDGDVRYDASLRTDFSYNGVTPDLSTLVWEGLGDDYDELLPHIKKYEDPRTDANAGLNINNMWLSGKDIPVIRYADVLLSYAECLNETGDQPAALHYVNSVRQRAHVADWTPMSKDNFRTEMLDERMRELFAENWRRFDLIRTGTWKELVSARNKWTARSVAAGTFVESNMLFPIPQTELNQNDDMRTENGEMDQNPNY